MFKKSISLILSLNLIITQPIFAQGLAQLNMAQYLGQIHPLATDIFRPAQLRYFSYDNLNNSFQILLDKGDFDKGLSPQGTVPYDERLKDQAKELMDYFLIGVTLPNDAFWVNLRPDSPDNIIDPELEKTGLGKILLEADLQLKKDTASFTSPQTPEGKAYWDKLYKKAGELFGSENITIPTLTRPWIVSGEIIVRESGTSAYIYKATLKVMLEADYLKGYQPSDPNYQPLTSNYSFSDPRLKELNEYSSQIIRESIIPKLTQEVNSNQRYAKLRQVYYSLVLSRWFKMRFTGKSGQYASLINKHDLTNLTSKEPYDKLTYFKQYQESFAQGEYNLKEPVYTPYGQSIRSYMSGGFTAIDMNISGPGTNEAVGSPVEQELLKTGNGNTVILDNKLGIVNLQQPSLTIAASRLAKTYVVDNEVQEKIENIKYAIKMFPSEAREFIAQPRNPKFKKELEELYQETNKKITEFREANDIIKASEAVRKFYSTAAGFQFQESSIAPEVSKKLVELEEVGSIIDAEVKKMKDLIEVDMTELEEVILNRQDIDFTDLHSLMQKLSLNNLKSTVLEMKKLFEDSQPQDYEKYSKKWSGIKSELEIFNINEIVSGGMEMRKSGSVGSPVTKEALLKAGTMTVKDFILINIKEKLGRGFNNKKDLESVLDACKKYMLEFSGKYVEAAKIKISKNEIREITGMLLLYFNPQFTARPEDIVIAARYLSGIMKGKFKEDKIAGGFEELAKEINNIVEQLSKSETQSENEGYIVNDAEREKISSIKRILNMFPGDGEKLIKLYPDSKNLYKETEEKLKTYWKIEETYDLQKAAEAALEFYFAIAGIQSRGSNVEPEIEDKIKTLQDTDDIINDIVGKIKSLIERDIKEFRKIVNTEVDPNELDELKRELSLKNSKAIVTYILFSLSDTFKPYRGNIPGFFIEEAKKRYNNIKTELEIFDFSVAASPIDSVKTEPPPKTERLIKELKGFLKKYDSGEGFNSDGANRRNKLIIQLGESNDVKAIRVLAQMLVPLTHSFVGINWAYYKLMVLGTRASIHPFLSTLNLGTGDTFPHEYYAVEALEKLAAGGNLRMIEEIRKRWEHFHRLERIEASPWGKLGEEEWDKIYEQFFKGWNSNASQGERIQSSVEQINKHFKKFGLSEDISSDDFKKEARRILMENHPDRHMEKSEENRKYYEGKTKELLESYKVITNWYDEKKQNKVSSAIARDVGGIDFTDRAMRIGLEPMGSFADLKLVLPEISNVAAIDLDNEFKQIQIMATSGIRPSDTRILEFAAACYYRGEFSPRLGEITVCLQQAHFLDERLGRESSPTLRLATMLPEVLYSYRLN